MVRCCCRASLLPEMCLGGERAPGGGACGAWGSCCLARPHVSLPASGTASMLMGWNGSWSARPPLPGAPWLPQPVPVGSCLLGWKSRALGRPGPVKADTARPWEPQPGQCSPGAGSMSPCVPSASGAVSGDTGGWGATAVRAASSSTMTLQSRGSAPGSGNPALWQCPAQQALMPIAPRA